jgi:hypothetical protein
VAVNYSELAGGRQLLGARRWPSITRSSPVAVNYSELAGGRQSLGHSEVEEGLQSPGHSTIEGREPVTRRSELVGHSVGGSRSLTTRSGRRSDIIRSLRGRLLVSGANGRPPTPAFKRTSFERPTFRLPISEWIYRESLQNQQDGGGEGGGVAHSTGKSVSCRRAALAVDRSLTVDGSLTFERSLENRSLAVARSFATTDNSLFTGHLDNRTVTRRWTVTCRWMANRGWTDGSAAGKMDGPQV